LVLEITFMKHTFLLLATSMVFVMCSYAQTQISNFNLKQAEAYGIPVKYSDTGDPGHDDLVYRRDLIKYFRSEFRMPEFVRTGNHEQDVIDFNINIKYWYQQYPQFVDVLDLRNYDQFYKYDASCYDLPPAYTKGCTDSEEKAYRKRFNNWQAHHPDAPKKSGDDEAAGRKYELELAAFHEKYFKK